MRFLVTDMRLYKRLRWSVGDHRVEKWENKRLSLSVGVGWGVNGGQMPLPVHPRRYCDSASLVRRGFSFFASVGPWVHWSVGP